MARANKNCRLTDEDRAEIIARLKRRETWDEISVACGVSKPTILTIACGMIWPPGEKPATGPRRTKLTEETRARVIELLRDGIKPIAIAEECGVSERYVYRRRRAMGS